MRFEMRIDGELMGYTDSFHCSDGISNRYVKIVNNKILQADTVENLDKKAELLFNSYKRDLN